MLRRLLPGRLDRYLLAEVAGPFLMCLGFLYALLLMLQLMRGIEVLFGAGVGLRDLAIISLYQGPHFLVMAMPISLLFAVILAVGRLSEDREVLALLSSGIAPTRLLRAPLLMGLLVGGAGLWLSHGPDPRGLMALKLHVNEMIKRNMAGGVKPGVFYNALSGLTLYAQEVQPGKNYGHLMIADERDPAASLLLLADRGRMETQGTSEMLTLALESGEIQRGAARGDSYAVIEFDHAAIHLDVGGTLDRQNRFGRAREDLTPRELEGLAARAREAGDARSARLYDIARARRVADPLAAFVFALCAVPLAMGQKGGARAIGALTAIGAYVAYYAISRMGEIQVSAGTIAAPLAANAANLLFLGLGAVLMIWTTRSTR